MSDSVFDLAERFPRCVRLTRRTEFEAALAHGFRVHGRLLVVHVLPNDLAHSRLGLTVPRRVGTAVVRNRTRRRLREIFRRHLSRRLDAGLRPADVLVRVLPAAGEADQSALRTELDAALTRWGSAGCRARAARPQGPGRANGLAATAGEVPPPSRPDDGERA